MNGNNSNNGSNMVSPEELSMGGTGLVSSTPNGGGMQNNPFSQSQQVYPPGNSSSMLQQQNPFQNSNPFQANNPFQNGNQVVNQPVNVPQQMMNQPINNNFQVSESQQVYNGQHNFYNQQQQINQVSQPMINNIRVNNVIDDRNDGSGGGKEKNITKSLFIVMTIIFLIFGIATVYVINIPSELECNRTYSDSVVPYNITYNYFFRNETLKDEKVTMSIDLGSDYDTNKEVFIEKGKQSLQTFIDNGFEVNVIEQKPRLLLELHGEGDALMKVHDVNVYFELTYKTMKFTAENNNFVCK